MKHWRALTVLGTAQFLMILDTSVMNVPISRLVDDFDTEVTAIQAVITLYALVMAAFMIIGGRSRDILGRRRMFLLGLVDLGRAWGPRRVARVALLTLAAASMWLLATVDPVIGDAQFAGAMALLGVGVGLLASQLGNVVQSGVGEEERSEAGGLQFTAQNLGSALGTALSGRSHRVDLIGALAHAFSTQVAGDPRRCEEARAQAGVSLQAGVAFVAPCQVRSAAERAGLPPSEVGAVADSYASAQRGGPKAAILATGGIALASFLVTPHLPTTRDSRPRQPDTGAPAEATGSTL
ncbi:hypothetical protein GCM10027073_35190 [Streptomyces chlorus]|uniref:MFS transporter n=1 Tax=Streptomyces chlorus TaxID=887452 RepID=A0ABW1E140_9ACTN